MFGGGPPASFQTNRDEPVALNDADRHALEVCSLHNRLVDVASPSASSPDVLREPWSRVFEAARRNALLGGAASCLAPAVPRTIRPTLHRFISDRRDLRPRETGVLGIRGFHPSRARATSIPALEPEPMKSSTEDQAKGKLDRVKGKIKEAAGVLTGQDKLESEGKNQQRSGKIREKIGQVEKVLGK